MTAVPVSTRTAVVLGLGSLAGLVVFCWPLVAAPQPNPTGYAAGTPMIFLLILPLLVAVLLAEVSSGGIDAKAPAMLGCCRR